VFTIWLCCLLITLFINYSLIIVVIE
jgi:hypothetical protein